METQDRRGRATKDSGVESRLQRISQSFKPNNVKPKILIIQGSLAKLRVAFKALDRRLNVLTRTIYPMGGRYRMMVGGFLSPDEMAQILNDQSLKITEK